jgi:hypothetical protein
VSDARSGGKGRPMLFVCSGGVSLGLAIFVNKEGTRIHIRVLARRRCRRPGTICVRALFPIKRLVALAELECNARDRKGSQVPPPQLHLFRRHNPASAASPFFGFVALQSVANTHSRAKAFCDARLVARKISPPNDIVYFARVNLCAAFE